MSYRWQTEREGEVTLDGIREFVDGVARDLDPESRYVRELRDVLAAASDVEDYMRRLHDAEQVRSFQQDGSVASLGERGRSWVDGETWERMDPFEQTLSNLLTGETRMMWARDGVADWNELDDVLASLDAPRPVLSVPCSTGKEPFSIAIAAIRAGLEDVSVVGVDRQDAYLERARSGFLVPHKRDLEQEDSQRFFSLQDDGRTRVADSVRERCSFEQGDVLTGHLPAAGGPRFALVTCRNLLGYFRGESLETAWRNVVSRVRPGGVVLFDPFVTESEEMRRVPELLAEAGFTRRYPAASFYDAPA